MSREKINEAFKAIAVSALCIGLFGAGFVGINSLAFAAAMSKAEIIPVASTPVSVPAESLQSADDQKPGLAVYDATDESVTVNPNALSAEEAAELGARYIWDMVGESIEGMTVRMTYRVWPSHTRAYWEGGAADSKEAAENFDYRFMFTICAVSGERIDMHNITPADDSAWESAREGYRKLNEYRLAGRSDELDEMFAFELSDGQLEEYGQLVKGYAAKHFTLTEVVDVAYLHAGFLPSIDENGNLVVTASTLSFTVSDSAGRKADVSIRMGTKELVTITSSNNDIVPGFDAYVPGSLG